MEKLLIPLCAVALMGCSTITVQDNAAGGAPLVLEEFFDGHLTAHGVILTRGGSVRRSFNATMDGVWREREGVLQGTLTEDFVFNDGEKLQRVWEFTKTGEGTYTGTASDVTGTGTLATSGNALRMDYVLQVPVGDSNMDITVEDWLWLMEPDVIVNKSSMYKFGFRVGEIITTILKRPQD